jgi:hypothetical protein
VTSIPDKIIYHYDGPFLRRNIYALFDMPALFFQLVCRATLLRQHRSESSLAITPDTLPARVNGELIKKLQTEVAPTVFSPKVVYDGRKNIFSTRLLPLGASNTAEVLIPALYLAIFAHTFRLV